MNDDARRAIMKKRLLLIVLVLLFLPLTLVYASPPLVLPSLLNFTAPAGGETWTIGQTKAITWTSSNINGNVTILLYRGGIAPANRVGIITQAAPVAGGKYTWQVGQYLTGTAAPGNGYQIVIKTYNPSSLKVGAPFNLVAALPEPKVAVPPAVTKPPAALKMISLTYPHRGDLLHKGIPFTITWNSINLNQTKLKIQLMNIQGTTVIRDIANDIPNTGERGWGPPMDLPDEKTLYKIRIQTMDGAVSNLSNPFFIAKATTTSSARTLEVQSPLTGDRYTGDTMPVKWTTTINCSAAGGPTDEAFFIDLMDESGSNKVRTLADSVAIFDSEGPTGILNWHWDWLIEASQQPGTYMIRVKNWNGQCVDKSDKFRIFKPRKWVELKPVQINFCPHQLFCGGQTDCNSSDAKKLNLLGLTDAAVSGPPSHGLVGISIITRPNDSPLDQFVVGSWIKFHRDPRWYKKMTGRIVQARLIIKRIWKLPNPTIAPCFGGVFLPTNDYSIQCRAIMASSPGAIPITSSQGDTWEVELTQKYLSMIEKKQEDHGIVLYGAQDNHGIKRGGSGFEFLRNAETYDVTLRLNIETEYP
jgi:hypothetical protein